MVGLNPSGNSPPRSGTWKWVCVAVLLALLGAIMACVVAPGLVLSVALRGQPAEIRTAAEKALAERVSKLEKDVVTAPIQGLTGERLESTLTRSLGQPILEQPASEGVYEIVVEGSSAKLELFASAKSAGNPTFSSAVGLFVCFSVELDPPSPPAYDRAECPPVVLEAVGVLKGYEEVDYTGLDTWLKTYR